jgi:hypothetical protein
MDTSTRKMKRMRKLLFLKSMMRTKKRKEPWNRMRLIWLK